MRKTPAVFQAALCVAVAALPPLAMGQPSGDRATVEAKGGYARILFLFTQPSPVEASIADGVLKIELKRPVEASVDALAESLKEYVSVGRATNNGLTYRFALRDKVRLHISRQGARTAVDLVPDSFKGEPPDLPRPPPPPPKQELDASKLPVVKVRVGEFESFTRLTFDWPSAVRYTALPGKGRISVRFETAARPDLSALEN